MRNLTYSSSFSSSAISAGAQQVGQNKSAGEAATGLYSHQVQTQLVVEAVVVKDKHGKFIHGLTAKDFIGDRGRRLRRR
jgi:nitrous oxidase accessory protein NosD